MEYEVFVSKDSKAIEQVVISFKPYLLSSRMIERDSILYSPRYQYLSRFAPSSEVCLDIMGLGSLLRIEPVYIGTHLWQSNAKYDVSGLSFVFALASEAVYFKSRWG